MSNRAVGAARRRRVTLAAVLLCVTLPGVTVLWEGVSFYVRNRSTSFIVVDGRARGYVLHVPSDLDRARPVPLVLSLHGAGLWGAAQRDISRWDRVADREGFVVAYPSGEGRWSPRLWATAPGPRLRRDVEFITRLIDTLVARHNVDPGRVYVNGLSNGAGMTFALSCAAPAQVAAAGLVASALTHPWSECDGAPPMPVVLIHGARDVAVPYDGGTTWIGPNAFPSIPQSVGRWAERNGCAALPRDSTLSATVSRRTYRACVAHVVLYTLREDGHVWPGGGPLPHWLVGEDSGSMEATEVLWEFFQLAGAREARK